MKSRNFRLLLLFASACMFTLLTGCIRPQHKISDVKPKFDAGEVAFACNGNAQCFYHHNSEDGYYCHVHTGIGDSTYLVEVEIGIAKDTPSSALCIIPFAEDLGQIMTADGDFDYVPINMTDPSHPGETKSSMAAWVETINGTPKADFLGSAKLAAFTQPVTSHFSGWYWGGPIPAKALLIRFNDDLRKSNVISVNITGYRKPAPPPPQLAEVLEDAFVFYAM